MRNERTLPEALQRTSLDNLWCLTAGACDELDQMFLLSAANPGNAMDVFLVDSIRQGSNNTPNATIVGIDGSIPGPAGYSGTVHSGAVVTLADLFSGVCSGGINLRACGADHVAFIAAHETGHFLGLFHTTEMEGADFDPIADSPKCPCLSCASATDKPKCTTAAVGTEMVTNGQCNGTSCGGGNNLMFWLLDSNYSTGALSAQQGAVMRLNPAVHP